jgi:hypothetical protein
MGRPAHAGRTSSGRPRGPPTGHAHEVAVLNGGIMRRHIIAPIVGTLTLGFVVVAVVAAGATAPRAVASNSPPALTGPVPLSQAAVLHRWLSQPSASPGELPAVLARLRAATGGATPPATPAAAAGPLAADVFNHDTAGLPQVEESVTACGRTVLGGTIDFRSALLAPPQEENGAGWHLSTDNGRTVRNEGLLPPVTIAGQPVPARGDPVDVAGRGCSLYASSIASTPDDRITAVATYRSQPGTLATCPGGTAAAGCWPTRRVLAAAELPHFLDKEWMAVGPSGQAGEVVWVSFTDITFDATGNQRSSSVKAVRCNPTLTICTDPILVSGSDQHTSSSDVTVGPDGRTYLSWVQFLGSPETGLTFALKLRVAPPGSTRFGPARIVATEPKPMVAALHANAFRAETIPKNDVKMVGGHPRVFVVWEGCGTSIFGVCEEPRINLARSSDFGASWRRTVLSVGGDNYFPTLSEDRGGAALAVAWYTNRHDRRWHSRQDVELASVDPGSGAVVRRQRLTPVSNETEADVALHGQFIGDYFEVFARRGVAYVHYNANYRLVRVLGQGIPVRQADNYLTKAHL